MRNSMNRNVPWGIFNISKLILTGALILLTLVDFIMAIKDQHEAHIYSVDIYTPVIKIVSFVSKHTNLVFIYLD